MTIVSLFGKTDLLRVLNEVLADVNLYSTRATSKHFVERMLWTHGQTRLGMKITKRFSSRRFEILFLPFRR